MSVRKSKAHGNEMALKRSKRGAAAYDVATCITRNKELGVGGGRSNAK